MKTTLDKFMNAKGQFVSLGFKSIKKPAAAHKGVELEKYTVGTFRAGIDFANLGSVKAGIANGEREEVQALPWGEWESFPHTITHKGARYFRLYPSAGHKVKSSYYVDGKRVEKRVFASYLTPSAMKALYRDSVLECFTVKESGMFFEDSQIVREAAALKELADA
jgi:hypothetical protein